MYSQYMEGSFAPLSREAEPQSAPRPRPRQNQSAPASAPGELLSGLTRILGGKLRSFSAEPPDSGDILLVLIILFLYLEGDNLELVITLGLMLLLND
ncbi:MAG: hypothetical protein PUB51_04635 [Oscillospiraceae bacterium]|nr:hypothetical protein [Oscillospiraceae bacterium]